MTRFMRLCAVLMLALCVGVCALGESAEPEVQLNTEAPVTQDVSVDEEPGTEDVSAGEEPDTEDVSAGEEPGTEEISDGEEQVTQDVSGEEEPADPDAEGGPFYGTVASDITGDCRIKLSSGRLKPLRDGKISTTFGEKKDSEIRIRFPEGGAGYVYVQWYDEPKDFEFVTIDGEKNVVSSITDASAYFAMSSLFRIDSTAVYAGLRTHGNRISELRVYSHGEVPDNVQNWLSSYDEADMLVFAAHVGDELGCFGGVVPYYAVERDKRVQIIFMTRPDNERKIEALSALWSAGIRHYPIFLDLPEDSSDSKSLIQSWGGRDAITANIVEILRSMRPSVVMTHDSEGENGDIAHVLTAAAVHAAVLAASNASEYQESTQEHGTWQVKKFYTHLNAGAAGTIIDCTRPSAAFNGSSAEEAAKKAYKIYSRHEKKTRGGDTSYTLTFTRLDIDTEKNDFFEGLDIAPQYDESGKLITTPAPTNEPALIFEETASAAPTKAPDNTDKAFASSIRYVVYAVGAGLGIIALFGLTQVVLYVLRRSRGRRYRE